MRRTPCRVVLAAALVLATATGCSSGEGAGPDDPGGAGGTATTTTEPRLDIDPRSYFDDYEAAVEEDVAASSGGAATRAPAPATTGAPQARAFAESATDDSADVAPPVEPVDPAITDGNTFVDPGANPFVAAAQDPESTFGLDVDTGSFTVGRTFLDQGLLPPAESVRVEEWVNAFDYDDEAPAAPADHEDDERGAAGDDLAVSVEGAPAPFADDGTQLVRVGVTAREVAKEDRPDAHITLVVDTSGSMDIRERLGLVRSTLALLALELRDTDTVSVVTYSDASSVLLPPTPAAEAERIVGVIDQLVPQGSTNMEAGLRAGYEQARSTFDPEAINTVVLASDGVANTGLTGTDPLSEFVREQGVDGIRLVTVGYGMGNYNDDLMEQLADRGDGFYSYVDTYEEAERLFTTELTSTLTVVAEDAKAQVTFDPEAVESYRLVGYENRAIADEAFEDDAVEAGELGAGHAVSALYELRLADGGPDGLGTVTLRHTPVGASQAVSQDVPLRRADLAGSWADAGPDLRLAGDAAAFAEVLAGSPVSAERGVTLDRLAALDELAEPEAGPGSDGGADGAGEPGRAGMDDLAELVRLARQATGSGSGGGEPVPPAPVPVPTPQPR